MKNMLLMFIVFFSLPSFSGQWNLQLENDVTFSEDGNYTNGLLIGWESDPTIVSIEDSIVSSKSFDFPLHFHWQKMFFFPQENTADAWGAKLSQRMWTPEEIKIELPQPHDRPYAGVLELESHTAKYGKTLAQKNWISIGVIGPSAGAEKLQSLFHGSTGSSTPYGWQYQIEDQFIVQVAYEIDKLLIRQKSISNFHWDISAYNHTALGNLRSSTDVGLTLRWGNNLEHSFGRLSSHYGHIGNLTSLVNSSAIEFFGHAQMGYRFNDLTLEGNLPYQSLVETQHLQAKFDVGVIYTLPNFSVIWSFNSYSKDFQSSLDKWHGYGSLSLSWSI